MKINPFLYVLLDFDGLPIRYYTYKAKGTKRIKYVPDFSNECLF